MAKNTVCHIEYQTTDLKRSQKFYEAIFGWQFKAFTDSMVIFGTGDQHVGGLLQVESVKPASYPSTYFSVESIDQLIKSGTAAGGTLLQDKHEVPTVGWSATLGDPDGNPVGVVQFSEER